MDCDLTRLVLYAPDTLRAVIGYYNQSIFPAQIVAGILLLVVIGLPFWQRGGSILGVALVLALCWTWCAVAWFGDHYLAINWAGAYYAAAFGIQAVLLVHHALPAGRLSQPSPVDRWVQAGWLLAALCAVAGPFLGLISSGGGLMKALYPGTSPEPTTVISLGLLLTTGRRVPPLLLIIPSLWLVASGVWAVLLGIPLNLVWTVAGLAGTALILIANRQRRPAAR